MDQTVLEPQVLDSSVNEKAQRSKRPRKQRLKRALIITTTLLICLLLFLWYVGVFGGNVRAVMLGKVYRSAQLTGPTLDSVLDSRGIRTMINLRGESSDAGWYRSEVESCQKRNVAHLDIELSAVRLPPPTELKKLLLAFDQAQYPVLFHCRGGADRSGLAGVLYLNIYQKVPLDQALASQLTWRYGHLSGYVGSFAYGQAHAMDEFFNLYRKNSDGVPLKDWILNRYPALYAQQPASLRGPGTDEAPKPVKSTKQAATVGG